MGTRNLSARVHWPCVCTDRGQLVGITDDFCVVIKGNGIVNEIGAKITRDQLCKSGRRKLDGPLREVHGGRRDHGTSAIASTTGTGGHSATISTKFH